MKHRTRPVHRKFYTRPHPQKPVTQNLRENWTKDCGTSRPIPDLQYLCKGIQCDSVHMLGGEEAVQHVDEEDLVALGELEAIDDHILVQVHHPLPCS